MLELRPNCELCDKELPNESTEAMICSFECTFCIECVQSILLNTCPNCGGGFEKRPIRPAEKLKQYPPSSVRVFKLLDQEKFNMLLEKYSQVEPKNR